MTPMRSRSVAAAAGLVSLARVLSAEADFTGSVAIDPFAASVSLSPGTGSTTSVEAGNTGGIFDTLRYTLHHPDLVPDSPGYSGLSLETDPVGGRLVTQSWGAPTSAFAFQWHECSYFNSNGSSIDLSTLVSFSHDLAIVGSLHGTTFQLEIESLSGGSASAWGAFSVGTWSVQILRDDFSWESAASWSDITSITFRWGLFGPNSYGVVREISNLNANFIPSPGAVMLAAFAGVLGTRRRR